MTIDPGALIRNIITLNGSNVLNTAKAMGMDRATLTRVIQGHHSVTRDLAFRMGAYFGNEVADLIIAAIRAAEDEQVAQDRAKWTAKVERKSEAAPNLPPVSIPTIKSYRTILGKIRALIGDGYEGEPLSADRAELIAALTDDPQIDEEASLWINENGCDVAAIAATVPESEDEGL